MKKVLFDEKEKKYMNNQPAKEWEERENAGLIIENGEIVGFEK